MPNLIDYNFQKLIEEIQLCCKNKQYFVALSTALILPDICSKIESKQGTTKKEGKPYILWCNKWLDQYLPSVSFWSQYEGSWGQIIYKLRCGILHSGEADVCGKNYICFDLENFNFYVNEAPFYAHSIKISTVQKTGDCGRSRTAKIDIDIRYLIYAIINGTQAFVKHYHLNDKDVSNLSIRQIPTEN